MNAKRHTDIKEIVRAAYQIVAILLLILICLTLVVLAFVATFVWLPSALSESYGINPWHTGLITLAILVIVGVGYWAFHDDP